ncbi:hypothetical protein [Leptospira santarosai]|uniref:hypothetical protein n=1 Tax=Leptospira santarosai TaxID=28183 RepID=UPI0024AFBC74|nr:hypothetical protein [Leptospira santarosai]MDI7188372.1 hypothetical protein [Leptospira santarosai]MDI7210086.1 hypothetical protein [Leptospira santarosai]MDI7221337.1 hypothetical protein [Leptospira santarosai]
METEKNTSLEKQDSLNVEAVGKLTCTVNLDGLPSNWSVEIISFTPVIPSGNNGWYAINNGPTLPYTLQADGQMVSCILSSTNVQDSGIGPSGIYTFQVTDEKGYTSGGTLQLGSTEWGVFNRASEIYLTFDFLDDPNPPQMVLMLVPTLLTPDPFSLGFGEDGSGNMIMVASADQTVTTFFVAQIIQGIITLHTTLLAWIWRNT